MARAEARSWPSGFSRTSRDCGGDHVVLGQALAHGAEQRRRDGEVEHPHLVGVGERAGQLGPAVLPCPRAAVDVEADVGQAVDEPVEDRRVELLGADEAGQVASDLVAVAGLVEPGSRGGDDAGGGGQLPVAVAEVEGRQQLADGEVAGAAEDHDVGGRDGGRAVRGGHRGLSLRGRASHHRRQGSVRQQAGLCLFAAEVDHWRRSGTPRWLNAGRDPLRDRDPRVAGGGPR